MRILYQKSHIRIRNKLLKLIIFNLILHLSFPKKIIQAFNNIFSSHFRTQNLQSQLMRNSRHGILRLSPSRSFTNSTSNSANSTTSTKASSKKSTFYSNLKNIKKPVAVWLPVKDFIII